MRDHSPHNNDNHFLSFYTNDISVNINYIDCIIRDQAKKKITLNKLV